MFIACGTSFHAAMACRQTVEELTEVGGRGGVLADVALSWLQRAGWQQLSAWMPAAAHSPYPSLTHSR